MGSVTINKSLRLSEHLSPHFTLGELCKTSVNSLDGNIPSQEDIENLKRLCPWLEELRLRYNQRYVSPPKFLAEPSGRSTSRRVALVPRSGLKKAERGGVRGGLNSGISGAPSDQNAGISGAPSDHPAHPGTPPDSGGEEDTEEPIIISSGYRSPEVNRCVGGAYSSNHLTGCAVDIRCVGVEQAIRYAAILLDIADEWKQDYDELLIEKNRHGRYWVHFAVRPKDNRRKTMFLQAS